MTPKPATAARRDANEPEIVDAFRKLGWSVSYEGPLDLIIGKSSRTVLIEVKDGAKVPSQQKLTKAERKFIKGWKGEVYIVRSVEDAKALGSMAGRYGGFQRRVRMIDEIRAIQEGE